MESPALAARVPRGEGRRGRRPCGSGGFRNGTNASNACSLKPPAMAPSKRAGEGTSIEQNVLPSDIAGLR